MIIITAKRKDFTWLPWTGSMVGWFIGGWFGITLLIIREWNGTTKEWVGGIKEIREAVEYRKKIDRIFSLQGEDDNATTQTL